jgi:hypothetical protein
VLIDRDDQPRRIVAGDREKLRLQVQRHAEVGAEALQFDESVGLPLRRALRERQAARHREDAAEIDRQHVDARPCRLRDLREAGVAEVGPRRLRREVVIDDEGHG